MIIQSLNFAPEKNELQQLLQTTFCKNGSVCYTFEIHSIDGSVLQLDVPA
jgi:hypothetical protein